MIAHIIVKGKGMVVAFVEAGILVVVLDAFVVEQIILVVGDFVGEIVGLLELALVVERGGIVPHALRCDRILPGITCDANALVLAVVVVVILLDLLHGIPQLSHPIFSYHIVIRMRHRFLLGFFGIRPAVIIAGRIAEFVIIVFRGDTARFRDAGVRRESDFGSDHAVSSDDASLWYCGVGLDAGMVGQDGIGDGYVRIDDDIVPEMGVEECYIVPQDAIVSNDGALDRTIFSNRASTPNHGHTPQSATPRDSPTPTSLPINEMPSTIVLHTPTVRIPIGNDRITPPSQQIP
mmetsp:Transcript_63074/g.73795  ORF Transcript_63074/g.73795 Transcript_63074/m.73795 type:complete len:292 (+) Transcript_63074:1136-2011(+)